MRTPFHRTLTLIAFLSVLTGTTLALPASAKKVIAPFDGVCYGGSEGDLCGPENVTANAKCIDEGDRIRCRFLICDDITDEECIVRDPPTESAAVLKKTDIPPPKLAVDIPTVSLSRVLLGDSSGNEKVIVPWIAEYISGAYVYAVGAAAVVAAVMIMIGGFQYLLAGGNSSAVGAAKKRMLDATAGLLLVVGAYLILSLIDPGLTKFESLGIVAIKRTPYVYQDSGDSDAPLSGQVGNFTPPYVYCPKSGGADAIPQIIDSLKGKVAYRFGGKGGPPPYQERSPDQMAAMGKSFDFYKYNTSCPDGNVCFDCSGFVNFVLQCAGLSTYPGGTTVMFSNSEKVESYDLAAKTVNGVELKPGDLLGFIQSEGTTGVGHVYLYIGDGKVAEAAGGESGRQPGANPQIHVLDDKLMDHVKHVTRAR